MNDKLHDASPDTLDKGAEAELRRAALEYHRSPTRGKIEVRSTKTLINQRDLSLAYSPGVAYACTEIERDPSLAAEYTSRANLLARSPTAPRCSAWATSARWPASR